MLNPVVLNGREPPNIHWFAVENCLVFMPQLHAWLLSSGAAAVRGTRNYEVYSYVRARLMDLWQSQPSILVVPPTCGLSGFSASLSWFN